jgi:REP element-mobilizing transposase RayT
MCLTKRAGQRHCAHRGWNLLAAHVRSNHVHVIVEAEIRPERMPAASATAWKATDPIENGGRGMEAGDGYGRTRM